MAKELRHLPRIGHLDFWHFEFGSFLLGHASFLMLMVVR